MFQIVKLTDSEEKTKVATRILRSLPEWFGIEESIVDYAKGVQDSDFYTASLSGHSVGFISIKTNNAYTSEIYVMGILKEYQKKGIGKALLRTAEESLKSDNFKFLMVKTLSDTDPDENYKKTREFYKKAGFYPLQELIEIWGKENPCLIMVKSLN